jgi:hypothetical protein
LCSILSNYITEEISRRNRPEKRHGTYFQEPIRDLLISLWLPQKSACMSHPCPVNVIPRRHCRLLRLSVCLCPVEFPRLGRFGRPPAAYSPSSWFLSLSLSLLRSLLAEDPFKCWVSAPWLRWPAPSLSLQRRLCHARMGWGSPAAAAANGRRRRPLTVQRSS